jgi:hypothetical protein
MPMQEKTFTEYGRNRAGLMNELPGRQSREQIMLAPHAAILKSGTVLGLITDDESDDVGAYAPIDPGADDGTETAVAILLEERLASPTESQRAAIIARGAEWAALFLFWPAGITADEQAAAEAQLAEKGILVRHPA